MKIYCWMVLLLAQGTMCSRVDYQLQNIYVNSIPKCGTHLLTRCIELLTGRPLRELQKDFVTTDMLPERENDEFFATHVRYSKKAAAVFNKNDFKTFLIIRDPRDKIISRIFWLYQGGWEGQSLNNSLRDVPFNDLIMRFTRAVNREYHAFLPWSREKSCCIIKFENLVGPRGGGTQKAQVKEIKKIAQHMGLKLTDELLWHCIDNLFGNTVTFRSGKIGAWKKHFSHEHKKHFKKIAGKLLIELGYEKDTAW